MSEQLESSDNLDTETPSQHVREPEPKKRRIDTYFRTVAAVHGSDIHIKSDAIPRVRVNGELRALKTDPLSVPHVEAMTEEILSSEQIFEFKQHGTIAREYAINKTERF